MKLFKTHKKIKETRKRQWGTERSMTPLPMMHEKPSTLKIALSRVAIVATVIFWALYISSIIFKQLLEGPKNYNFTVEAFSYSLVVTFLTFSALMYLIARQGALQRFSKHVRVPRTLLDKYFAKHQPSITVLVPSYSEETSVIRKTLLSAALQEYPSMRVVLLIDDNPNPTNPNVLARLNQTRALGKDIEKFLSTPYRHVYKALTQFEKRYASKEAIPTEVVKDLSAQYAWAANWLVKAAKKEEVHDHVDVFFTEQVFGELAKDLSLVSEALEMSIKEGAPLAAERIHQLYRRLVWIFQAKVATFERKKYASLSHEANKAMNLNSYIGLMGGTYREEKTPEGLLLMPVEKRQQGNVIIPDSEFLLTLDADSILLRDYCLRLVYFLQQPGNEKVAVTQTPYSSFRGAYSRIERLSGATTDIQHLLHQGFTHYGATFWVGANAVIRKLALEDIVEKEYIGGFEIKRYIQDRTVIEDTESSIDLALHGWTLINYPERLSYSATPPDFGALVVQRRRWANGGLLILPKLWATIRARKNRNELISRTEVLLRVNYMASIAWSSFGGLFILAYPYDGRLLSPLVLLAAMPYFLSMASDLKYNGYRYSDVFRIYGFNLILLFVNLAGVVKSIEQSLTGKKIPFARTPKINDRTSAGIIYVLTPVAIVAFSLFTIWRNVESQNWANAAFAGLNAFFATWAIISYIGLWELLQDTWFGLTDWLYVDGKTKAVTPAKAGKQVRDWRVILYHGEENGTVPHQSLGDLIGTTGKVSVS